MKQMTTPLMRQLVLCFICQDDANMYSAQDGGHVQTDERNGDFVPLSAWLILSEAKCHVFA